MRGIINLLALLIVAAELAVKLKKPLSCMISTVWCLLMLVLQVFSCFHCLDFIDVVSLFVVAVVVLYWLRNNGKRSHIETLKNVIMQPVNAIFLIAVLAAIILNYHSAVYAWDDVNYWAASVRSLYERNGLEGKYFTVASGWGDYPHGQQLIQWWFVHSFSNKWNESLLFIGYYIMLFSFMIPFVENVPNKKWPIILGAFSVVLFPLVHIDDGILFRLNADVLMAIMYGSIIYGILKNTEKQNVPAKSSNALVISIQLAGLTMIKSIGIFWSLSAAVLYYLRLNENSKENSKLTKKHLAWQDVFIIVPTVGVYASWKIICKVLERETYLINMLRSGDMMSLEWYVAKLKGFIYTACLKPAMVICGDIGIPPAFLVLLPCIMLFYFWRKRIHDNKDFKLLTLYFFTVSVVYAAMLLYSYFSMFMYEPQALDSLPRYVLPLIVLVRVILWYMYRDCPKSGNDNCWIPIIMAAILMLSYNTFRLPGQLKDAVVNKRDYTEARDRYALQYSDFYKQLAEIEDPLNSRIYYFDTEVTEYDRIHLCYLANGAAITVSGDLAPENLLGLLADNHATHVIIYPNGEYDASAYQSLMADDEVFEFGKVYKFASDTDSQNQLTQLTH